MIQNIPISKLHPHPDNPRKDLGDLSELVESIRANGVLQNLTAVPWFSKITGVGCDDPKQQEEMGYTVVIGHRRLAAAKKAGLEELPCAISDMNRREQIATMLLENMQRSDLTVYEQAQGIQMMMDLGENVASISEMTGFSESTIRRRVKMLELDGDKFKKATERGATLMDFAELEKIQSIELRNEVLMSLGTKNFAYVMKSAIDKEKAEVNKTLWIEALSKFASEETDDIKTRQYKWFNVSDDPAKVLEVPQDAGEVKYFFRVTTYSVSLMRESTLTAAEQEADTVYQKMDECTAALRDITARAYMLRRDFILNFAASKKHLPAIIRFWVASKLASNHYTRFDDASFAKAMGLVDENGDFEDLSFSDIHDHFASCPERVFLVMAYCDFNDDQREGFFSLQWHQWPFHEPNERLDALYESLKEMGYQISDEERTLQDGTHELLHKGDQPHE